MRWYFISYKGYGGFLKLIRYAGCCVTNTHGNNLKELIKALEKKTGWKNIVLTTMTSLTWDQYKELVGDEE